MWFGSQQGHCGGGAGHRRAGDLGVLTTDTMQQALERAGIKSNLGWSYGLEALEMGA